MIERKDPGTVAILGGTEEDVRRHIESDFLIRSGMCPNGHGLMSEADGLQECPESLHYERARREVWAVGELDVASNFQKGESR